MKFTFLFNRALSGGRLKLFRKVNHTTTPFPLIRAYGDAPFTCSFQCSKIHNAALPVQWMSSFSVLNITAGSAGICSFKPEINLFK